LQGIVQIAHRLVICGAISSTSKDYDSFSVTATRYKKTFNYCTCYNSEAATQQQLRGGKDSA